MRPGLARGAFLIAMLLVIVGPGVSAAQQPWAGASITGAGLDADRPGATMPFRMTLDAPGNPVGVDFRGTLVKGSVQVQISDAQEQVIWAKLVTGVGSFVVNEVITPTSGGNYMLGLAWDGPVQAQYALQWQPGKIEVAVVSPLALMGGLGMVGVALVALIYAARRRLGWGYLGLGALSWVVTVALKFAWAIPLNPLVYRGLSAALPPALARPLIYLYTGALTGVFEVGILWLALRFTRLGRVAWPGVLAFGIGFSAVEALLLGVSALTTVATALLAPATLPVAALAQLAATANPLFGLAPVVERAAVILVHIGATALIFYAAIRRRAGPFWLAFAGKTALDAVATAGQVWGMTTLGKLWAIEAVMVLLGAAGWAVTRWVARRYPAAIERGGP